MGGRGEALARDGTCRHDAGRAFWLVESRGGSGQMEKSKGICCGGTEGCMNPAVSMPMDVVHLCYGVVAVQREGRLRYMPFRGECAVTVW